MLLFVKSNPEFPREVFKRVQSNFNIVFISVSCEEKDYYRVVLEGQLGFDWFSYCRRSHLGLCKNIELHSKEDNA